MDDHSGFGQIAADVVMEVRQDYPTAPTLVFPVRPAHAPPPDAQVWHTLRLYIPLIMHFTCLPVRVRVLGTYSRLAVYRLVYVGLVCIATTPLQRTCLCAPWLASYP